MKNKFTTLKSAMKISSLMLTLALGMNAQASLSNNSTDGIVAVVNNEVILKSDLNNAVAIIQQRLQETGIQATPEQVVSHALDDLITYKLQMDLVNRSGMVTNQEIIDQQMLQIAQSQGLDSLRELQQKLDAEQAGSYAALRKSVIEEAALQALWQSQVSSRIHISDAEVTAFLNSPEGKRLTSGDKVLIPEWQVSHILVKVDATQSPQIAEQKINALYQQIQQGADFHSLAATYSDDAGSAATYGRLGWVSQGQMVPEFETTMKQTEVGDYSTPFRSQFGWHILKVEATRQNDITEQRYRMLAREYLFNRQAPQAQEDWLQELRSSAYIEIFK